MKKSILFAALFLVFSSGAYSQTSDSTVTTVNGATIYATRYQVYENGTTVVTTSIIADTATIGRVLSGDITSATQTMANDVLYTSQFRGKITEIIRKDNQAKVATGKSGIEAIVVAQKDYWLSVTHTWEITDNGVKSPVTFSITAAGVMKYQVGTNAKQNIVLLGSVVRLRNYSGTKDIDLFKINENTWIYQDRLITLRRSSIANK